MDGAFCGVQIFINFSYPQKLLHNYITTVAMPQNIYTYEIVLTPEPQKSKPWKQPPIIMQC